MHLLMNGVGGLTLSLRAYPGPENWWMISSCEHLISRNFHFEIMRSPLVAKNQTSFYLKRSSSSEMKISFACYVISKDGGKPGNTRVKAIKDFPVPTDATGVKSFLGLTNLSLIHI